MIVEDKVIRSRSGERDVESSLRDSATVVDGSHGMLVLPVYKPIVIHKPNFNVVMRSAGRAEMALYCSAVDTRWNRELVSLVA